MTLSDLIASNLDATPSLWIAASWLDGTAADWRANN